MCIHLRKNYITLPLVHLIYTAGDTSNCMHQNACFYWLHFLHNFWLVSHNMNGWQLSELMVTIFWLKNLASSHKSPSGLYNIEVAGGVWVPLFLSTQKCKFYSLFADHLQISYEQDHCCGIYLLLGIKQKRRWCDHKKGSKPKEH